MESLIEERGRSWLDRLARRLRELPAYSRATWGELDGGACGTRGAGNSRGDPTRLSDSDIVEFGEWLTTGSGMVGDERRCFSFLGVCCLGLGGPTHGSACETGGIALWRMTRKLVRELTSSQLCMLQTDYSVRRPLWTAMLGETPLAVCLAWVMSGPWVLSLRARQHASS